MDSSDIRLGVIDDHSIFRDGVKRALTLEDDFKVIGEGESADDAIAVCDELRPDVMIIDLKMPGGGIKAVTEIHRRHADVGLIVVTVQDDGVGMPADWSRPGHFGLRGLAERVERLGGIFSVGNSPTRGVRLMATVPLAVSR